MMTCYCVLEVIALFFVLGPLYFVFSIVQFHLLCLFFLKLSVVYVKCCSSIPFAEVTVVQVNAYVAPGPRIFLDISIYTKISMRHVCLGFASLAQ